MLSDSLAANDASRPPTVALLTAHAAPPLAAALRSRGINVTVVDHPSACWSMPPPKLLIVDAESLSAGEVARLQELFDVLQRRGVAAVLANSGLDRLDPEYVEGRAREVKRDAERSVD